MNPSNKHKWTDEEVSQWYKETGGITYSNKEDTNIIVRKPRSLGWTLNWANPRAYILLIILFAVIWLFMELITGFGT